MNKSDTGSIRDGGRIEVIDSLRGFALAGVCLVHMLEQYFANVQPEAMMQIAASGQADRIIMGINHAFFVGKFYMIFSLLFGVSFFIQIDNPARRQQPYKARFIWRLVLLFGFGFVHHFFYRGDILMLYAVLGLFLIPLHTLSSRYLIILACALFLGLGRILSFSLFSDSALYGMSSDQPGSAELALYFQTLKSGTLAEVFAINAVGGLPNLLHFQFGMIGRGYITLGLFLLGIVIGRSYFFQNVAEYKSSIKKVLLYSVVAFFVSGALTGLLFSMVEQPVSFRRWSEVFAFTAVDLVNLSIALLICCSFLLISLRNKGARALSVFAPYGRMALSNYLLQAVIGTSIFFGWGFGKLGEIRNVEILGYALCVIIAQILFSHLWLKHFNYGPLEWLWRCATHRKLFPLIRRN